MLLLQDARGAPVRERDTRHLAVVLAAQLRSLCPLVPSNSHLSFPRAFAATCGQLLSVTEQLSIAVKHLQDKVQNRRCNPGMWEDEDTGVCGISGCTNSLYDEYDVNATTDSGCEVSPSGCCRVLSCVTTGECKPPGSVQQLAPENLDGKPGDCIDDPFHYLEATTNRRCDQLQEHMNSFGSWANGQSLHALDRTHMNFGCDSTVAEFMKLLDQSGQRDCFDHDETLIRDGHGTADSETTSGGCQAVVDAGKCEESAVVIAADPSALYSAYCPVACGLCHPPSRDPPHEFGVTQAVNDDGAYIYSYTYPWVVPNGAVDPTDAASRVPVRPSGFLAGSGWRLTLPVVDGVVDPYSTPSSLTTGFISPRDAVATEQGAEPIAAETVVTMADVCPITCNQCGAA
jgi:hypothetical protein